MDIVVLAATAAFFAGSYGLLALFSFLRAGE